MGENAQREIIHFIYGIRALFLQHQWLLVFIILTEMWFSPVVV